MRSLREQLDLVPIAEVDPELYFDYQFNRPTVVDGRGRRAARSTGRAPSCTAPPPADVVAAAWPTTPSCTSAATTLGNIYLLLGTEPSRSWKSFTAEIIDAAARRRHRRHRVPRRDARRRAAHPADLRLRLQRERRRAQRARARAIDLRGAGRHPERARRRARSGVGIPTCRSGRPCRTTCTTRRRPKATLALIERLEELVDVDVAARRPGRGVRGLGGGIDALASDDDDMAAYIAAARAGARHGRLPRGQRRGDRARSSSATCAARGATTTRLGAPAADRAAPQRFASRFVPHRASTVRHESRREPPFGRQASR